MTIHVIYNAIDGLLTGISDVYKLYNSAFFIFSQLSVPSSTEKTDLDLELSSIHGSQTSQQIEVIYPVLQMVGIIYQMNTFIHKLM